MLKAYLNEVNLKKVRDKKRARKTYFPPVGVSSALNAFTSEFGMESGGTHLIKSRAQIFKIKSFH